MTHENLYTPDCIRTFKGHYIDPFNPDPEKICIEDIAHALSHIPRFGGHLPAFYSVAQHSIFVHNCFLPDFSAPIRMAALLHDASEAYLLDLPKPIKTRLPGYAEAEKKLLAVIFEKFNVSIEPDNVMIKTADSLALQFEWENNMLCKFERFTPPSHFTERKFLELFNSLSIELASMN